MTLTQILMTAIGGLTIAAVATLIFLPRDVTVTRSAVVAAPPETIMALAESNSGYQRFNPYLSSDPDLKIDTYGPDRGVGSGFRFEGAEGKGTQTVAEVNAHSVRYDIDLGAMGKPTQTISAIAQEDGSEVTWQMKADLGLNPIARVMGVFMDRMVGPTFERGLSNLDAEFQAG